jgi:EmrB/QacA subfamily drug resistance transporter
MSGEAKTGASPLTDGAPRNAGAILAALILAAAVCNVNLAVANVALPTIGAAFDASQTQLNLIAVGYSLGLAASVLYLGAVGDRYGRKMLLLIGTAASIPLSFLAAYAPSPEVLVAARILGGVTGGLCYPTTLALIAALWRGGTSTRAIALWSAIGASLSSLGPMLSGFLLGKFWWGSVFLVTVPIAILAFVMCRRLIPGHVAEGTEPVDHLGGVLSIVLVGSLILAINFAPVPNSGTLVAILAVVFVVMLVAFVIRQRRVENPLYDLAIASRVTFWVAAVAGIIVFGSLMGAMFIGQQFLQNVLEYDAIEAGASILPAAILMILVAPRSAKMVATIGSRATLLTGYVFVVLGFLTMMLVWSESSPYWQVGLAYALVGMGVGFAATPAAHSLTGSVPTTRVGMASGTADLQRDLGGALMTSILGAVLAAGYAKSFSEQIAGSPNAAQITDQTQSMLTQSFASAEAIAQQNPQYAAQITAAAREAFLAGDQRAYLIGLLSVLIGAVLVFFVFPRKDRELELHTQYETQDAAAQPA